MWVSRLSSFGEDTNYGTYKNSQPALHSGDRRGELTESESSVTSRLPVNLVPPSITSPSAASPLVHSDRTGTAAITTDVPLAPTDSRVPPHIAHRSSRSSKTSLRCVYYWTKHQNTVARLSFASWYEYSTLHPVADGKPLNTLPFVPRFLHNTFQTLEPETSPLVLLPYSLLHSFASQILRLPEQLGPSPQSRPAPCASLRTTPHSGSEVCRLPAAAPFRTPGTHHQPGYRASAHTVVPPPLPHPRLYQHLVIESCRSSAAPQPPFAPGRVARPPADAKKRDGDVLYFRGRPRVVQGSTL
ncbi:hypothetical protein V497_05365, partial [Pseudogymnoascus sp. VKM F-4516 (FW-969)]